MLEKLRNAYFVNTTSVDSIRQANIALLSDMYISDSVIKTAVLQANVNNIESNQNERKNTFLYR